MPWDVAVRRRRLSLWRLPFENPFASCLSSVLAALMARPAYRVRLARRVHRARLWPVAPAPRVRPARWVCKVRLDPRARRAQLWSVEPAQLVLSVPPARKV